MNGFGGHHLRRLWTSAIRNRSIMSNTRGGSALNRHLITNLIKEMPDAKYQ